jgi:Flp pilus assembly protein TadD
LYAQCTQVSDTRQAALLEEARCRRMLAQPAEARRCLAELLVLTPQSAPAWRELARLEISLGRYREALAPLQVAERHNPHDPETRRLLAAAAAGQKLRDAAER